MKRYFSEEIDNPISQVEVDEFIMDDEEFGIELAESHLRYRAWSEDGENLPMPDDDLYDPEHGIKELKF